MINRVFTNDDSIVIYRETFFRPPEISRIAWTLPAELYNQTRLLLNRSQADCVFIPLRTMQYLAVIDAVEIIFIDAVGGYMSHRGQGGRLIELAWQNFHPQARQSIIDPVTCEVVYYSEQAVQTMKWLIRYLNDALTQMVHSSQPLPLQTAHIILFSPRFKE